MIRRTNHILTILLSMLIVGCNSNPERESENASVSSDSAYASPDTVYDEWGNPAPPPEMKGDGSSLFSERHGSVDINVENLDAGTQSSGAQDDVISNWINSQSSQSPVASRPSTPRQEPVTRIPERRQPTSNTYTMDFNWNVDNPVSEGDGQMLPYAANDDDKADFLRDFYALLLSDNENKDLESYMSVSCKNYLREANFGNRLPTATFFGLNSSSLSRPSDEVLKNLSIKSLGYDWFAVSWGNGSSNRPVELKVIEMNRSLLVDMIR